MNMRYIDLTGKRFGNYTVLRRVPSTNNNVKYLCHCDCGTEKIVYASSLRSGKVVSCGCHKNKQCGDNFRKHGLRRSIIRLYGVWSSMKGRCLNPNNQKYSIYGGRGIKVCDEWRNDFKAFYDWAYANGYDENAPKGADLLKHNRHFLSRHTACRKPADSPTVHRVSSLFYPDSP